MGQIMLNDVPEIRQAGNACTWHAKRLVRDIIVPAGVRIADAGRGLLLRFYRVPRHAGSPQLVLVLIGIKSYPGTILPSDHIW